MTFYLYAPPLLLPDCSSSPSHSSSTVSPTLPAAAAHHIITQVQAHLTVTTEAEADVKIWVLALTCDVSVGLRLVAPVSQRRGEGRTILQLVNF